MSGMLAHTVIPACGRLKLEDHCEFEASLGCVVGVQALLSYRIGLCLKAQWRMRYVHAHRYNA